jgi:ribosomal-protein-alanine N-acetyltransferase
MAEPAPVPMIAELRTERLLLRTWRDDDLAPYAQLSADPRVMEYFPKPLSRDESDASAVRFRDHFTAYGFGMWAVEVPGVAPFIGFVGLCWVPFEAPFTPAVEIGWRLAAEHWGRGYASEGAHAALAAGFGQLGLDDVVSMAMPGNLPSLRVMEKLGMQRSPSEDFLHPWVTAAGPKQLRVLYRISRAAWAARAQTARPGYQAMP